MTRNRHGYCFQILRSSDGHGWEVYAEDHDGSLTYVGWSATKGGARDIAARW
jgi:hypothetical protein